MTKEEARKQALKRRDEIPDEKLAEYSGIIEELVLNLPQYKKAENVFLYSSFRSEVKTTGLVINVIKDKGFVFLPKVMDKTRMSFFRVRDLSELKKSRLGIPEPEESFEEGTDPGLFIIPMAAFSKSLDRAGYGGGYYDRYLKRHKGKVPVVGLAFFEQLIPEFETDEYDLRPDMIITQKGIIKGPEDIDRILKEYCQ